MTTILKEFAALRVVERLGWTLIHSVWQATVVALIVAAVLHACRYATSNRRYLGLCVGLLTVAAAPFVTFLWLSMESKSDSAVVVIAGSDAQGNVLSGDIDPDGPRDATGQRLSRPAPGSDSSEREVADSLTGDTPATPSTALMPMRLRIKSSAPWIVGAWILGVGMFSVWHLAGWLLARRLTTHGTRPVAAATQAMLERLMQRMEIHAAVRILESTATAVPIVVGWIKPVLLMPASVLSGLPTDEIQAILAHELAHVRRQDFLVNVLQTVVETCLFYHPAVWWLSRQIRIERELCADDEAVALFADRGLYARALVSLADFVRAVPGPAVAATGGSLTRRIHRVLGLSPSRERPARHPSWLISAVLGLSVLLGLLTSSIAQLSDQSAKFSPIKELAERLVLTQKGWTLHECDDEPSVAVAGYRGFRLVLRRTWKESTKTTQQQVRKAQSEEADGPFEVRQEDWEFVLIPIQPQAAPSEIKAQIKWRKSTSPFYTRDLCLGQGWGYVWFTRGTLFGQEFVRESLKLEGGDDRIQLAMDGLQVQDAGTNTSNSCMYIPAKFGDRALPFIERTIEQAKAGDDLWRVVGCLAYIQTDRATELLSRLFDSKNEKLSRAAQYALIHTPYRKAAKRAYLEMLKRQSSLEVACPACVEFQWKEAVPILQGVIARPQHLAYLRYAIPTRRTLEGRPIDRELLDAEQTLHALMRRDRDPERDRKIDAARRLLVQTDDSEAANLAALSLAIMTSKGGTQPVNEAGLEILKSRPRQATVDFLKSLAAGVHEKYRPQVEELLKRVEEAPAPGEP